jgi:hypothetical protein
MKIIDRLPFGDRPHIITVRGEPVDVYRNQIIVWISIDDVSRPLPAILDTGHGHNLSIGEGQLRRWSGASLSRIGELEVGRERVIQYAAAVSVHRNVPGQAALRGDSYLLEMPQGISVFQDAEAPRLPLIGLRTIVANKLILVIDGDRRLATLKTKGWL